MYTHLQLREQHEHVSHRQIGRRALLWLLIMSLLLVTSLYAIRFVTISRLQQQVAVLSMKEQSVLDEQSALRACLARKDDPQAIEDVAREELGLVKPGEQLIIFVEGD